ncbi:MAG: hypothetical protein AVDCRST_MAG89-2954, partial [uncultured Gemmatimonadetes bacterium]
AHPRRARHGPPPRTRARQPAASALHRVHAHPAGRGLHPAVAGEDPGRALHHHAHRAPRRLLLRGDVPDGRVLELHRLGAARGRGPPAPPAHRHAGRAALLSHHPQHLRHHRVHALRGDVGDHGADAAGVHLHALLGLRPLQAAPVAARRAGARARPARAHAGADRVRGDDGERAGRDADPPRVRAAALGARAAGGGLRGRRVPAGGGDDGAARAAGGRLCAGGCGGV